MKVKEEKMEGSRGCLRGMWGVDFLVKLRIEINETQKPNQRTKQAESSYHRHRTKLLESGNF